MENIADVLNGRFVHGMPNVDVAVRCKNLEKLLRDALRTRFSESPSATEIQRLFEGLSRWRAARVLARETTTEYKEIPLSGKREQTKLDVLRFVVECQARLLLADAYASADEGTQSTWVSVQTGWSHRLVKDELKEFHADWVPGTSADVLKEVRQALNSWPTETPPGLLKKVAYHVVICSEIGSDDENIDALRCLGEILSAVLGARASLMWYTRTDERAARTTEEERATCRTKLLNEHAQQRPDEHTRLTRVRLARALAPPDALLEDPEDTIGVLVRVRADDAEALRAVVEKGASRSLDKEATASELDALAMHAADYHIRQQTGIDFTRLFVCDDRAPFAALRRLRRHVLDTVADQPLMLLCINGTWKALNRIGHTDTCSWGDVVLCKDAADAVAEFLSHATSLKNDRGLSNVTRAVFHVAATNNEDTETATARPETQPVEL